MELRVNVFLKSGFKVSAVATTDDSPAAWIDRAMKGELIIFDGGYKAATVRVSEIESIEALTPDPDDLRTDRRYKVKG